MLRGRFIAAVAALAATSACDGVPPAQNYATVFGRVYDAATNAGIAGVTVIADTALTAVTAADGSYSISPLPSGQTDLQIVPSEGYRLGAQPTAFSVVNGERVRMDISLDRS